VHSAFGGQRSGLFSEDSDFFALILLETDNVHIVTVHGVQCKTLAIFGRSAHGLVALKVQYKAIIV
jgi:hypothetical protein